MNICAIVVAHDEDQILPFAIASIGLPYIAILDNPTAAVREATKGAWHIMETPPQKGPHVYNWQRILDMIKEAALFAHSKGFQWVLRVDADEDWSGAIPAIEAAAAAGCNVCNFLIAQHSPLAEQASAFNPQHQRRTQPGSPIHLEPDGNFYHRAWAVDGNKFNIGAGGHVILRHEQRVHESGVYFNHYPAIDRQTLKRKATRAYNEEERKKGWHIQYDGLLETHEPKKPAPVIDKDRFNERPIHLYFHIAMMGIWEDVLAEQIRQLCESGILAYCASVTAVCVGDSDLPSLPSPFTVIRGGELNRYEFPTLEAMQKKAETEPDANYLYLHTKGVSKPKSRRSLDAEWRRYMMWGCVENWKECASAMHDHDVAGVEWYPDLSPSAAGNKETGTFGFFAGNFFWARGDFLNGLPPVAGLDQENRWNAEAWIGTGNHNPSVYEVANIHCRERPGMFPRNFDGRTYRNRDRIILVNIRRQPKKPKRLRMWLVENIKPPEATVYIVGVAPGYLNEPQWLICKTPPRHYTEVMYYD